MHVLFLLLMFVASYTHQPFIDNQPAFRTTAEGTLLTVYPPPPDEP